VTTLRGQLALVLWITGVGWGQPQDAPSFEVASIKPARPGPPRIQSDPVRITISNESIDVLIRVAYRLREYQYQGPDWLRSARYDIVAATPMPQSRSVQLQMLRTLLADRFKLGTHQEARTLPVYALVVGKNGSKLHPMDESLPAPFELYSNFRLAPAGEEAPELRGYGTVGQLCDFLSRLAGRPVIDQTGISGNFDFKMRCAVEGYPGAETGPSVFEAVQQLGLKLEARTSAVEMTIVDHVEKPSGN